MSLQDTASTAGILAELNNRLTSYESTIRELRSKNRDFVNRLRDSQQIRKDLCIKVNSLQNDLDKKDKELKQQKDQNKQLKKKVTNLNELNSNYQCKIEELKSLCEELRSSSKFFGQGNEIETENNREVYSGNKNSSPSNRNFKNLTSFSNHNKNNTKSANQEDKLKLDNDSICVQSNINANKSLLVKEGDLEFSVEEINEENMKYIPIPDDPIDRAIATFTNSRENKILFTRVKQGTYVYGRLMVEAKLVTKPGIDKNKPLLRIVSRGKLYTLADFVNTHENEELNNIENSIKNQKNANLLSEGKALVVTSPLNNFRTISVPTPSSPIAVSASSISNQNQIQSTPTSASFHQYHQSPISQSSNRIPMVDSKQSQNVNIKNYLVNYQNNMHDFITPQATNSPIPATFYQNIGGIRQYSVNNNNSFNFKQTPSLISQQYQYYQLNEGLNHMNQYNQNMNYQFPTGNGILSVPPPLAEYMPVTTPIIMTRQPINTVGSSNISISNINSSSLKNTNSNSFPEYVDLNSQNKNNDSEMNSPNQSQCKGKFNKISSPILLSRSQIHNSDVKGDLNYDDSNNKSQISQKSTQLKQSIQCNIETGLENEETKQLKKNNPEESHTSFKSVSSSTINGWYRQANILRRFNTFENLPISHAKI